METWTDSSAADKKQNSISATRLESLDMYQSTQLAAEERKA